MSTPSQDNDEVRRLLNELVPEVADGSVEVKGIAREPGRRCVVVVHSSDAKICPVGACVGRRGERIKSVVRGLPGDKVDIVRWSDSLEDFIQYLLNPSKIELISFDAATHSAGLTVSGDSTILTEDGGIKLLLASRLSGWNLQLLAE